MNGRRAEASQMASELKCREWVIGDSLRSPYWRRLASFKLATVGLLFIGDSWLSSNRQRLALVGDEWLLLATVGS